MTEINAERFLHDGGLDSTQRYFLTAANARGKVVVIDTKESELLAVIETEGADTAPRTRRQYRCTRPMVRSGRPRTWATIRSR